MLDLLLIQFTGVIRVTALPQLSFCVLVDRNSTNSTIFKIRTVLVETKLKREIYNNKKIQKLLPPYISI